MSVYIRLRPDICDACASIADQRRTLMMTPVDKVDQVLVADAKGRERHATHLEDDEPPPAPPPPVIEPPIRTVVATGFTESVSGNPGVLAAALDLIVRDLRGNIRAPVTQFDANIVEMAARWLREHRCNMAGA